MQAFHKSDRIIMQPHTARSSKRTVRKGVHGTLTSLTCSGSSKIWANPKIPVSSVPYAVASWWIVIIACTADGTELPGAHKLLVCTFRKWTQLVISITFWIQHKGMVSRNSFDIGCFAHQANSNPIGWQAKISVKFIPYSCSLNMQWWRT